MLLLLFVVVVFNPLSLALALAYSFKATILLSLLRFFPKVIGHLGSFKQAVYGNDVIMIIGAVAVFVVKSFLWIF